MARRRHSGLLDHPPSGRRESGDGGGHRADWSRIVRPQAEGIAAAVSITRADLRGRIVTFVNVNNHYEGSAPLTIERFLKELARADQ